MSAPPSNQPSDVPADRPNGRPSSEQFVLPPLGRLLLLAAAVGAVVLAVGGWSVWQSWQDVGRFDEFTAAAAPDQVAVGAEVPSPTAASAVTPTIGRTSAKAATAGGGLPAGLPSAGNLRTFLVFSHGTTNITRQQAHELGVPDYAARGADTLTDVLMLVVTSPNSDQVVVLSIPRDTWLEHRNMRINAVYPAAGPQALADEVAALTGIGVDHLVGINFAGFAHLVDEVGGVTVDLPRRIKDEGSHLAPVGPGRVTLEGTQALAYARSRKTQALAAGGSWARLPSASDFGRMERQQQLLAALWSQLRGPRLVAEVPMLADAAADNVMLDKQLGLAEVRHLAVRFKGLSADTIRFETLPATPGRAGRASVVRIDTEAAAELLSEVRHLDRTGGFTRVPAQLPAGDLPESGG